MAFQFYSVLIALPLFVGFIVWLEALSRAAKGNPFRLGIRMTSFKGTVRSFFKTRLSHFKDTRKGALGVGSETHLWL